MMDAIEVLCKIMFITYAWITMRRLNKYLNDKEN